VLATLPENFDQDESEHVEPKRHEIGAGDFIFIPPWTEHQMINETDEDVVWVVIYSGPHPTTVDLTEWGGPEVKYPTQNEKMRTIFGL